MNQAAWFHQTWKSFISEDVQIHLWVSYQYLTNRNGLGPLFDIGFQELQKEILS